MRPLQLKKISTHVTVHVAPLRLQLPYTLGVSTFGGVNATDLELTEKVIRGWAHLLSDRDNAPVLSEARKELDGLVSNQGDLSPIKVHRQPASKGTPPLLAASAPGVPSPFELPPPYSATCATCVYVRKDKKTITL